MEGGSLSVLVTGAVLAQEPHFPNSLSGKEKPLGIYLRPCSQQGQLAVLTQMLIYTLRNKRV